MNILITCGPSYEPIDGARRLTNFSTGTLGVTLANDFTRRGHNVICLRGEGSTCCIPCEAREVHRFGTNEDLARLLQEQSQTGNVDAVLHAAALCDYKVEQVLNDSGQVLQSQKFATRDGRLHLALAPALKVLPKLRSWFPEARIMGWKYELAGTRDEAFERARRQMEECATDACVLNGAAYGTGFALCDRAGAVTTCETAERLGEALSSYLQRSTSALQR